MRKVKIKYFITFLLFISCGLSQDSIRLVSLYNSTDGPNWINNTNWLSDIPISEWYGVSVQDSSVISIELLRNHLSGQLPNDLYLLANLEILDLSDNNLSGELPDSMINLKILSLSHNNFSGNLTNTFKNYNSLISLDLSYNNFSGSIPKELGKLMQLEILNLSENNLHNKIPIEIFRLNNLVELNLKNNSLTGSIPRQISNCKKLNILDFSRNKLTGNIPKEIGKLINLTQRLALDHNDLNGMIPKEISFLTNLQHIWLNNNQLSGILPFEIGDMKSLRSIFIYQNNFVGPIPLTVGNLRELEIFYGQNNSFGSKVPLEFWFLPKLKMLRLDNNKLSGMIPADLRILKSIQSIDLSNNRFDSMSDSIVFPNSLLSFNISHNSLFCDSMLIESDIGPFFTQNKKTNKIIGLDQQNCNNNSNSSFIVGTSNIDFQYVMTDSTAKHTVWIVNNDTIPHKLFLHHFDNNNFYTSDTSIVVDQIDTVYISVDYSPIDVDNHYDVLIFEDILNKNSQYISITGEGVESLIPERDISIPWRFMLHPISTDTESDTLNIQYDVPEKRHVNITIFNLGGRPIKTVIDDKIDIGFHTYAWDGSDRSGDPLEGGEYLCVMQAGMFIQIQQILLLY